MQKNQTLYRNLSRNKTRQGDEKMIHIAICDDKQQEIQEIKAYLEEWSRTRKQPVTAGIFKNSKEFLDKVYEENKLYDIVFLDIDFVPDDGIRTASKIRQKEQGSLIIFLAEYPKYIFQAFEVKAFRYIIKEKMAQEFIMSMDDAVRELHCKIETFFYEAKGKKVKIPFSEILYFESRRRMVQIKTKKGEKTFYGKLDDVESSLADTAFIRCHQSYIVNLSWVREIRKKELILENGEAVPVSESRRETVCSYF